MACVCIICVYVCMYVCMYMYVCVCIVCIRMCVCMYVYVCMCVYVLSIIKTSVKLCICIFTSSLERIAVFWSLPARKCAICKFMNFHSVSILPTTRSYWHMAAVQVFVTFCPPNHRPVSAAEGCCHAWTQGQRPARDRVQWRVTKDAMTSQVEQTTGDGQRPANIEISLQVGDHNTMVTTTGWQPPPGQSATDAGWHDNLELNHDAAEISLEREKNV